VPRSKDFDLRDKKNVKRLFETFEPEVVIHMAVHGGGIGYMKKHPASIYYDNILINTNMVHASMEADVGKFVGIGTVCEYPKFTQIPFKEEDLWKGYPEETNAPYGLSKKMMLVQTQAYHQEYGFRGIHLLLANLFGPHDNFHPEHSHVIPALIVKACDAQKRGEDSITVWGTGNASREFLYVEDAAEGIMLATERYEKPEPVNIGSGKEVVIKDLVSKIVKYTGFKGKVIWDATKPDGQPKRHLDVSKAKEEFGFVARTDFDEGLKRTISWYRGRNEK
jgi:GDP-L-fucose synthase